MILVVDITKGIQTQTAECLVIGEITCSRMIVVLNKIDAIAPADKRAKAVEKMTKASYIIASARTLSIFHKKVTFRLRLGFLNISEK